MCNGADLKAITRRLVDNVGGVKNAAKICEVSEGEVSLWQLDHRDRFIPVDHLVMLDAAGGDLFLKELARDRGFELSAFERNVGSPILIPNIIGTFAKASGVLACTVLEAQTDGFTPAERRLIRDDIAPVKDGLDQLENVLSL